MNYHIYHRWYNTAGARIFTALICLIAVYTKGICNSPTDKSVFEHLGKRQTLNVDTVKNCIFADSSISVKTFRSVIVDNDNTKWFITEKGIVSFDGIKWILHNKNRKVPSQDLKNFAIEATQNGQELWIASPKGATVASLPIDENTDATTYHTDNTPILSNNVVGVAIGKSPIRWLGTSNGISAFRDNKWLKGDYDELYPEGLFQDYPITSMATNAEGDSLYVATEGAGIARVQRNDADGITGASVYARWGPIRLPSDKIYSIFIASNNTQWFGTDRGIARHTGSRTLANWTVFTIKDGLINNFVQCITADKIGQIWIGTRGGASLFDGSAWNSFTKANGLNSNNILCIAVDKTGIVWFGTDDGVTSYDGKEFKNYR